MKKDTVNREWSTEERLQELRGKLNLKERDNEAFFRYSQEKINEQDQLIKNLRSKVRHQREVMAACLNGDGEVINTALHETPLDQLTYQRTTADKCIEEKNQDVFDQVKKLNALKHQTRSLQHKIVLLERTLKNSRVQNLKVNVEKRDKTTGHDCSDQRVRVLSTRLDKVLLKINSARYVNITYKRLLSYLEKDSLSLPGRLDELEACLEQQKYELVELRKIHGESRVACDNTKLIRRTMEDEIIYDKDIRDKKLSTVRRSLKALNEEAEANNTIIQTSKRGPGKDSNGQDSNISHFTPERIVQKEALSRALTMLKETVGASTIDDIAETFETQLNRQQSLLTEAEDFQSRRERLLCRANNNEEVLKSTTYKDSVTLGHAHDPEPDLAEKDQLTILRMQQLDERIQSSQACILRIRNALEVFYKKACDLDESLPKGICDPNEVCESIGKNFAGLLATEDEQLIKEESPTVSDGILITFQSADNRRIELPKEDDDDGAPRDPQNAKAAAAGKSNMFGDDDDELIEVQCFSRDDMKKKSKELVNKANPKKKRK